MQKILLICDLKGPTRYEIEPRLSHREPYHLTVVEADDLFGSSFLRDQRFAVIIVDCHVFDQAELDYVLKLSGQSPESRFLILADQIALNSYRQANSMNGMVALQKPFAAMVFETLLSELTNNPNYKPARCPRFITDEPARMMVLNSGLLIPMRMRNYSASGAFLEYHGISLKVGDQVKLLLNKAGTVKASSGLNVTAKVIWIRNGDHSRSPIRGVGVQFVES